MRYVVIGKERKFIIAQSILKFISRLLLIICTILGALTIFIDTYVFYLVVWYLCISSVLFICLYYLYSITLYNVLRSREEKLENLLEKIDKKEQLEMKKEMYESLKQEIALLEKEIENDIK